MCSHYKNNISREKSGSNQSKHQKVWATGLKSNFLVPPSWINVFLWDLLTHNIIKILHNYAFSESLEALLSVSLYTASKEASNGRNSAEKGKMSNDVLDTSFGTYAGRKRYVLRAGKVNKMLYYPLLQKILSFNG